MLTALALFASSFAYVSVSRRENDPRLACWLRWSDYRHRHPLTRVLRVPCIDARSESAILPCAMVNASYNSTAVAVH